MSKIHMETDLVRGFAVDSVNKILADFEEFSAVKDKVSAIPWEGGNRESFVKDYKQLVNDFDARLGEGINLMVRVQKEVDGWIAVDTRHAAEYARERSTWQKIVDRMKDVYDDWQHQKEIEEAKAHFNDWWKTQDADARKAYLQKLYEKLAKQWGMETLPLVWDPIDGKGKTLGQYEDFFKKINLDEADLSSRTGFEVISDLAHEARHQYQSQCVRFFEQTGSVPEGVTMDQVETWKNNFDNYIPGEKNPIGYFFQGVEIDARVIGSDYANDYLLSQAGGGGSW